MDEEEEQHVSSLGIVCRLFSSAMSSLAAQALSPVSLFRFWLRGLAILHGLFNSLIKSLEAQALKPVTLGRPLHPGLAGEPSPDAPNGHPIVASAASLVPVQEEPCPRTRGDPVGSMDRQEDLPEQCSLPKKSVSFSETAEVIDSTGGKNKKKKKKKDKKRGKDTALKHEDHDEQNSEKEVRPVKSILKVPSDLS